MISSKNNFVYLLGSIVALLFSSAITDDFPGGLGEDFFSVVSIFVMIVGVKSIHHDVAVKRIVYSIAVLMGGLTILWRLYPSKIMVLLILVVFLVAFVGAFKLSVKQILFEGKVDANKIIGSLSLYLLLGLIWTILYLMILVFDPNALKGIEVESWRTLFSEVAYYSFTTLTTLGYGDISPVGHITEFVAYMEAVTGVFYMAIFVSSLINLRGSMFKRDDESSRESSKR